MLIRRLSLADVIPDWPTLQKVDFFALDEVWSLTSFILYAQTHFPHAKLGNHFLPSLLLYFCITAFYLCSFFQPSSFNYINVICCVLYVCLSYEFVYFVSLCCLNPLSYLFGFFKMENFQFLTDQEDFYCRRIFLFLSAALNDRLRIQFWFWQRKNKLLFL